MASPTSPALQFQRERLTVNGVDVVMLTAGSGEPLLYLHGAGTWHGFDFALPWASNFRVMIPYHPGWGESGDGPGMDGHGQRLHDLLPRAHRSPGHRSNEPCRILNGRSHGRDIRL